MIKQQANRMNINTKVLELVVRTLSYLDYCFNSFAKY